MRKFAIFVVCIIAVAAIAYALRPPSIPATIHIWQETDDAFWDHWKSLRRCIARALKGSNADVMELISCARYTEVSGAGFYGFGEVLLGVAREIGDSRFAEVCGKLPSDRVQVLLSLIQCGAEYGDPATSDEELHRQLPRTMEILDMAKHRE